MNKRRVLTALVLVLTSCAPEGPSAYISFNVPPDSNCVTSPSSEFFISQGTYDIARGGLSNSDSCANSYSMRLLVNSNLRTNQDRDLGRSEPNILMLHSAEVKLKTIDGETLDFGDSLPNPFTTTTANSIEPTSGSDPSVGIAVVEAIPVAYSDYLGALTGSTIIAEVQIFGTTTGDVDIDMRPFNFPIRICDGCLTMCQFEDILNRDLTLDDVLMGDCPSRSISGQDGRVCIDPDC